MAAPLGCFAAKELAFSGQQTQYEAMNRAVRVRVTKGEKYYIAECLDMPVVTQGKTLDELKTNLQEAITLHLEGEDFCEND